MTTPLYLRASDLARRWSVDPATVTRLVQRGELRAVRVGRSVRIRVSDVESFERRAEVEPLRVQVR